MGVPIEGQTGLNRRVNSPNISRIKQILPQSAPRTSIWNKSECKLRFTALLPRASLIVLLGLATAMEPRLLLRMPPPLPRRCRLRPRHNVEQDLLPTVNGFLAISDWQVVR
jgi:hypothetical protein